MEKTHSSPMESEHQAIWIALPGVKNKASVVAGYVLTFQVRGAQVVKIVAAADQQYELYLNQK